MHKYVVTVIIVQYHNIVVASAANRDEFSGLVGVNLAGGIKRGDETLMGFGFFANGEGIGMGFIGWGDILGIGGDEGRSFGRALVLAGLVEVTLDHGDRGGWVCFEGFGS